MGTILEIKDLTVKYGKITALEKVSLSIKEGELTVILGANGAGKTTLLKTISKIINPFMGEIIFLGKRIDSLPPDVIVKKGISHCPEGRKVFPRQTVYENLKLGAFTRNDEEIEEDIKRFYKKFPRLKERSLHLAGHLSGGEQQMLVICRALMSRPKLLLFDEPSMGLAPFIVRDVFNLISEIKKQGINILLVEQNARMALKIADKGYLLEVGEIVGEGSAKKLMKSEAVRKAYLGE